MKTYNKNNIPLTKVLREEQTKWEKHLWYDFLSKYPVNFQRQKAIGNYIVDFYCAKACLAVELDGYYHTTETQYREDKNRTDTLNRMNIEVIKFKNSEIESNFEKVCKTIDSVVKYRIEK